MHTYNLCLRKMAVAIILLKFYYFLSCLVLSFVFVCVCINIFTRGYFIIDLWALE
jgi:hypothetical protein